MPSQGAPLPPFRLLVVESDPVIAALYRHALDRRQANRDRGLQVTFAEDGKEALRLLATTPHDLLVTALFTPAMTGFTLIERIRADPRTAPLKVIVVSDGNLEHLAHARRLGADTVIAKPMRPGDVVETIRVLRRFQEYSFEALA
jgi:CheY-like chemotaxis protein